jgi:hypothetical protein
LSAAGAAGGRTVPRAFGERVVVSGGGP